MDTFVGEIRAFPYSFTPQGWLPCLGQRVAIQQYTPLYAIIGNTYGGDAKTYFNVPDLRGYALTGYASSEVPNLSDYQLNQVVGSCQVTTPSVPHNHPLVGGAAIGTAAENVVPNPSATTVLSRSQGQMDWAQSLTAPVTLAPATIGVTGAGGVHDNISPYMAMNYYICWDGVWPSRP